jgi:hypothetical protein
MNLLNIQKKIIQGGIYMAEQIKSKGNRNKRFFTLSVLGIIFLIVGICIVTIHGAPLRGSGAGTFLIIIGFIMLVIAALRAFYKRS